MKKVLVIACASIFVLGSCQGEDLSATYVDATADSYYGAITFKTPNQNLKEGDKVSFTVKPKDYYKIRDVQINGEKIEAVEGVYTCSLKRGRNKIAAHYVVDTNYDWVSNFHLDLDKYVYHRVMEDEKQMDFRRDGIEQAATLFTNPKSFTNYVDGDTTHVETLNYGYTVKIRYLGIDTPESTSELEEWGKTASIFNKEKLSTAKHIILQSQGWAMGAKTPEERASTVDGNGRSLAYVWYTDKEKPVVNDFRCLNLEMVYNGFSQGIGSLQSMGDEFYWAFDGANNHAKELKLHYYGTEVDPNYFYYSPENPPHKLTLEEIYEGTKDGVVTTGKKTRVVGSGTYHLESDYFDLDETKQNGSKTLYTVEGYVSRKVNGSFYLQDKPSYEMPTDGTLPKAYGLYVFTFAQTPIDVGDYVKVTGVLGSYSGSLQMMGVSWKDVDVNPLRDIEILSSGHMIKPIELTYNQYEAYGDKQKANLDHVLVTFQEDVYCYADSGAYATSDGGIYEVNRYNTKYPFYNDNNKLVFFGHMKSQSDGSVVRIVQDQNILQSFGTETSYSYKFYGGGTVNYNPAGAQYVSPKVIDDAEAQKRVNEATVALEAANVELAAATTPDQKQAAEEKVNKAKEALKEANTLKNEIAPQLLKFTYSPKKIRLTGIWGKYLSSSGKTFRDQISVVHPADIKILGSYTL